MNSISSPSAVSPSTSCSRFNATSGPSPGGTRVSIFTDARAGITFSFSDAWIIVGVSVTLSIGSTISGIAGVLDSKARE